jgi:acyl-ACP thioesterase
MYNSSCGHYMQFQFSCKKGKKLHQKWMWININTEVNVNNNIEDKQVNSMHSQPFSKTFLKFSGVFQSIGSYFLHIL